MAANSVTFIVGRRLKGTLLIGGRHTTGAGVVRALGAVQAQDYPGAKWALAQRTRSATDASLQREIDGGRILRTHVLRPTWHFVAPEDIRWMLALTGPRVTRAMSYYDRQLQIDAKAVARSHATIGKVLAGGKALTRQELRVEIEKQVGPTSGSRLARLMMRAECDALICSGPMRGKQFTYALLDERVPSMPALDADDALRTLTVRYFSTRGPATAHDFAWWSGLTIADVKRGIASTGKALEAMEMDGRTYWMAAGSRDVTLPASAHLIPNYDEFFIGYRNRSAIGQRLKSVKAVTGGNALIAHVVIVNGQLVGGWKRITTSKGSVAELDLLIKLTRAERALVDASAARFSEFSARSAGL